MYQKGINQYRQVGVKDQLKTADPHQITQLLMQSALENLAIAKGCLERKDFQAKAKPLAKATSIITSLKNTLDFDSGGEVAQNLDQLYEFMLDRLSEVALSNNSETIGEIIELMLPIKTAWDQIPEADKQTAYKLRDA